MTFRFNVGPSHIDRIHVWYEGGEMWTTDWWTTLHEWHTKIEVPTKS